MGTAKPLTMLSRQTVMEGLNMILICYLILSQYAPCSLSFWFLFLYSNDFSRMVAAEYLGYFNFTGQTLDQALRLVCSMSFH